MKRIVAALATIAIAGFATQALADPPSFAGKKGGKHHREYREHEHEREYEREHGHGKARLRGLHMERYTGGPPPWAPAHGYRRKAGWYDNKDYRDYGLPAPPIDLSAGTCNREVLGQVIGGGLGAAIGSQVGGGDGRLVAVAAGTILGVLVGGEVGRDMDRQDALCVDQALETAPDGSTITWNSGRETYRVTPTETAQVADGRYCREYRAQSVVGGQQTQVYGTACRQPDGSWQLVN